MKKPEKIPNEQVVELSTCLVCHKRSVMALCADCVTAAEQRALARLLDRQE